MSSSSVHVYYGACVPVDMCGVAVISGKLRHTSRPSRHADDGDERG